MANEQQVTKSYFRFEKVGDYFGDTSGWDKITKLVSYEWNSDDRTTLTLNLESEKGVSCAMLVQIVTGSSIRLRFHPEKTSAEDYPEGNTRNVVLDTFRELAEKNHTEEFNAYVSKGSEMVELIFHGSKESRKIRVQAAYNPFTITILMSEDGKDEAIVLSTSKNGLRFKQAGGFNDYHIIQGLEKPAAEKYVGFGEQGGLNLIKNNTQISYFNYDNMMYNQVYGNGAYEEREPLYHSDPFFIGVNATPGSPAYGIFVDNPSEVLMDVAYSRSAECAFGIRYGDMDYYVIVGSNCADIIKTFSNIVGTARLIPRYALGYHQGCYGYEKREDVENVVNEYRRNNIPIDGIHIDVDLQDGYKTFTVNESTFPNPKEMFTNLRNNGIKCSTNITPIISNKNADSYSTYQEGVQKGYFVKDTRYDADNPDGKVYYKYSGGMKQEYNFNDKEGLYNTGKPFTGEVYYGNNASGEELGTTGHYPDLNRSEVRKWWGKQYQHLFDLGLEMVWQDMTTPCLRDSRGDMLSFPSRLYLTNDFIKKADEDEEYESVPVMRIWNLYSYNLHKATYHGLNNLSGRENKRNFIIGRGCFTGMQRFAGLWTGDNASTWEFLRINIAQVLALGLTGQALSGQDIGGFEPKDNEQWADPELLIRWTSMGAFLPWFRNHYIKKGRKLFQEPYEYRNYKGWVPQDVQYLYDCVLPVCKYYIELRYTLMQLFYDAMFENTLDGMPICRALFLTNPDDAALFNDKQEFLNTEFMVRNEILVAPILEKESCASGGKAGKRDIYLPAGNKWYQFKNHKSPLADAVEGGTTVCDFDATINSDEGHIPYIVPLYVKEGAIIPVLELEQYVGEKNANGEANPIVLYIYPGKEGSYTMYLDDGVSRSSQPEGDIKYGADPQAKGEYREISITHSYSSDTVRKISVETVHDGYTPKYEDYMIIGILMEGGCKSIKSVSLNGKEVTEIVSGGTLGQLKETAGTNWLYDSGCCAVYIKVPNDQTSMEFTVNYQQ